MRPGGHGVATPGPVSDVPQQRSTRLNKGQHKNAVLTETRCQRHCQALSTTTEPSGSEAFAWTSTLHLTMYRGGWGRAHLGCSLQPSSDLGVWGLIPSHTWGPSCFTPMPSLPSLSFLIEVLNLRSFPCLTPTQGSCFCPQASFLPLENFLDYLWDQRKLRMAFHPALEMLYIISSVC